MFLVSLPVRRHTELAAISAMLMLLGWGSWSVAVAAKRGYAARESGQLNMAMARRRAAWALSILVGTLLLELALLPRFGFFAVLIAVVPAAIALIVVWKRYPTNIPQ